jgi:hypothetical protein
MINPFEQYGQHTLYKTCSFLQSEAKWRRIETTEEEVWGSNKLQLNPWKQKKKKTIKVNPRTMCSAFASEEEMIFFPEHISVQNIKTQYRPTLCSSHVPERAGTTHTILIEIRTSWDRPSLRPSSYDGHHSHAYMRRHLTAKVNFSHWASCIKHEQYTLMLLLFLNVSSEDVFPWATVRNMHAHTIYSSGFEE